MSTKRTTETISLDGQDIISMLEKKYPGFSFKTGKKLLGKNFKLSLQKVTLDPPKATKKKAFDRSTWEPQVGDKVRVREYSEIDKNEPWTRFNFFCKLKDLKSICGEERTISELDIYAGKLRIGLKGFTHYVSPDVLTLVEPVE